MLNKKCKICRRNAQKLFLKGEKCFSPKCSLVKRPFPPGPPKKKRGGSFSEYAKQLREKQKLQKQYGLKERQFRNYVKAVLDKRGQVEDAGSLLVSCLEKRLDNVIFRAGLAKSRREARQLVSHNHFLVNDKPVNISSFATKKGLVVALKPSKKSKNYFKHIEPILKNHQAPEWLEVSKDKMDVKIKSEPIANDVVSAVDIASIFEFYSR